MRNQFFEISNDGDLILLGSWTVDNYEAILAQQNLLPPPPIKQLRLNQVKQLDTNGSRALIKWLGVERSRTLLAQLPQENKYKQLLETVLKVYDIQNEPLEKERNAIGLFLEDLGEKTQDLFRQSYQWLSFLGQVLEALIITLFKPHRWRVTSLVANIDATGFKAIPIIMLMNFMVGAVVAFLGANILEQFGASIFTVHLVAFSFLREFAVLLTAILVAGRTASAFAAQIGSMKVNEEIDALKAAGVDPINILVLPRVLSLLISMPLLTFLAMFAGILGGLAVCVFMLNISPNLFAEIIQSNVSVRHFYVGLMKAPLFAFVIAVTGCLEGFKVQGSAQSVGERTTSSVVQSIFLVILMDALLAIFYMEIGW